LMRALLDAVEKATVGVNGDAPALTLTRPRAQPCLCK